MVRARPRSTLFLSLYAGIGSRIIQMPLAGWPAPRGINIQDYSFYEREGLLPCPCWESVADARRHPITLVTVVRALSRRRTSNRSMTTSHVKCSVRSKMVHTRRVTASANILVFMVVLS